MGRVPQHNIYTTKDKKLVNELHILERINTILLVLFFLIFFSKKKRQGWKGFVNNPIFFFLMFVDLIIFASERKF